MFKDNSHLRPNRAHEICGPAARAFALISAGAQKGSVLWVSEQHIPEDLFPTGVAPFCDPARILFAKAPNHIDVLWSAEEALRSGATPFVIAEINKPLSLTAGRRLQLAAEAGGARGLFLIPEGMGSNAAETRWRCSPQFDAKDSTLYLWQLIKNKSGTLGNWVVRWDEQARRIIVVSKVGERAGAARAPD